MAMLPHRPDDEVHFLVKHEDAEVEVQYTCNVHRYDIYVPFDHNLFFRGPPYGNRNFKIRVNCMRRDWGVPEPDLDSSTSRNYFFDAPLNLIEQNVIPILLGYNIPQDFCNSMAAKILEVAQDVANTACRSRRILCMAVDIMVDTFYYNHEYSQDEEESMEDQHHQALVPASKASIEELERVKIGGAEEKEGTSDCLICLEEFKADDEAIRMPCNHMFHSSCILNWLQRSNVCSLCRFELPPAVDDD